ncbi:MAG: exodeoxyribonuclease V subunit gamma [Bacteroidales bacterium]|jgi:exodeoxyribonuclease V gamma subunit
MGAVIYHADRPEPLWQALADTLRAEGEVFQMEYIVTQTEGMENRLKTELARKNGIFAHYTFLKQDHILELLYTELTGKQAYSAAVPPALYRLLGSEDFKHRFPHIAAYYDVDNEQEAHLKRIQLAGKTADLLDQYQVYRSEMVLGWENAKEQSPAARQTASTGESRFPVERGAVRLREVVEEKQPVQQEHEAWQRWLWLALRETFPWYVPKHRMRAEVLRLLQDEEAREKVRRLLPRLTLFGLSIFTPFYTQVLNALAQVTDVHYYMVLPGVQVLDKEAFDNPLNAALGGNYKVLAHTLPQPAQWVEIPSESVESRSLEPEGIEPSGSPTTLLGMLQESLRWDNLEGGFVTQNLAEDGTLVINGAYTPVREVEIFYNYLVDLMDKGVGLTPDRVLVLVPDLDTYTPYIKAVFDNAPYPIPYYIGGEKKNAADTVTQALAQLLAFDGLDAYPAEEVVALLEEKRIRRKYGIENTAYVRETVKNANIRFGLENKAADQTQYVGWAYGLEKIIMGFAVYDDRPMPSVLPGATFYPRQETETAAAYDIFRLKAFLDDLVYYAGQQKERKSFSGWKTFLLEEVLERSVAYSFADEEELTRLYKDLEYMEKVYDDQEIPFSVFRYLVMERLGQETLSGAYAAGRVSFLPVIPGRGLPAQVVAFLGMNRDVFPRRDVSLGFDLMQDEPMAGDRSKKENDKMAFLESLMAAESYFYVSYIGKDTATNEVLPPSLVVDQLLDYLEHLACADLRPRIKDLVYAAHPLHGFSSRYKVKDKRLYTYLFAPTAVGQEKLSAASESTLATGQQDPFFAGEDAAVPADPVMAPTAAEQVQTGAVDLDAFCRFFVHPIEWYYQKVLGIRYDDPEPPLPENELFDLDGLQLWTLKKQVFDSAVRGGFIDAAHLEELKDKGVKDGILPLAGVADLQIKKVLEDTEGLRSAWKERLKDALPHTFPVDITVNGLQIQGSVDTIYNGMLYDFSLSKTIEKQQVKTRIAHLVLSACGFTGGVILFTKDGDILEAPAVDQATALERMKELAGLYQRGQTERLPIVLNAVAAAMTKDTSEKQMTEYRNKTKEKAEGNIYAHQPADAYVARAWEEEVFEGDEEALAELIETYYHILIEPWE